MKTQLLFLLLLASATTRAQFADFENLSLAPDSFWAGQDGTANFFEYDEFYFPTNWDTTFGYWVSGWAYSNMTDSLTSGYDNQFSAKPGSGYNQSSNYSVALGDGYFLINSWQYNSPIGMWITNSTYAHNSMRDGDMFGKKFGGLTGDDPDYFYIEFRAYYEGEPAGDSIQVFLADFRFPDNNDDYIVKDWIYVDLSSLASNSLDVDSVTYQFHSSDIGEFGINTPKYFCMDDLDFSMFVNSNGVLSANRSLIYPNPAKGQINISGLKGESSSYTMYDIAGKELKAGIINQTPVISVEDLSPGTYFLRLGEGAETEFHKIIIQ